MHRAMPSHHPKYRTKLCRNFANGKCPFGHKCGFLHPSPGISPSSSSLTRHLFSWNALLLPQLLALSNQQATQKTMPRLPPRSQGPQLVDEGPSSTSSLLLSRSDCTSSDYVPQTRQTRQFNKRKKYPCRHFIRTGGWCPAGRQCKFFHDMAALSPGAEIADSTTPSTTGVREERGRTISGGVLMDMQSPSPPTVSQAHPEPPRYTEPELMPPYPSTHYLHMASSSFNDHSSQPMYWPNYTWQPYFPTVNSKAIMPVSSVAGHSSIAQPTAYPPLQPSAQIGPPRETNNLPLGSYEVNGTTYFLTSMPSVPPLPPPTFPMPIHPVAYNHTMAPAYPCYPPPSGYYDVHNQMTDAPQTSFDPFASERMVPTELPVIPRLGDYQMSPIPQDVLVPPLSSPSGDLVSTTRDKPSLMQEHEFPYRPPKDQRVGHARRISVNIKRHVRVNSG